MIYSRRQDSRLEFLSRLSFELVYRPGKTNLADPFTRNASCAYVSTILLAQEGRSSKTGISSDLQPDLVPPSPLDYAGEYVALEVDPYADGLQVKPSSDLMRMQS